MAHRVLVVDGEVEGLARIQAHLQPQGYAFTWALDAEEAFENVRRDPPDVVIVDAGLTGESAVELVARLRKGDGPRHVPILFAIQKGDEERRIATRRAGADEVLDKPFDTELLTVCIRQLIRLKGVKDELEQKNGELFAVFDGQRAFVESIVHDFKNPIAVVHVNLSWLAGRIGSGQTDLAEAISDAQE